MMSEWLRVSEQFLQIKTLRTSPSKSLMNFTIFTQYGIYVLMVAAVAFDVNIDKIILMLFSWNWIWFRFRYRIFCFQCFGSPMDFIHDWHFYLWDHFYRLNQRSLCMTFFKWINLFEFHTNRRAKTIQSKINSETS